MITDAIRTASLQHGEVTLEVDSWQEDDGTQTVHILLDVGGEHIDFELTVAELHSLLQQVGVSMLPPDAENPRPQQ